MIEPQTLETTLRTALGDVAHLEVEDLTGTKDHYRATIVSAVFAGKSRIEQHQLVYRALGDLMAGPIHALSLATYTPEGWAARAKG